MIRNRNKVEKASNIIYIFMAAIYLLAGIQITIGLLTGNFTATKDFSRTDAVYNSIIYLTSAETMFIAMLILNKKVDIYKEEYATSKKVFNLFFTLNLSSAILSLLYLIIGYFVYDKFSLYSLFALLIAHIPIDIISYLYVKNHDILSTNNDKKKNVTNFIVIWLLISYTRTIIDLLLQLVFKMETFKEVLKDIGVSIVFILIIILAYKLSNRDRSVNEVKVIDKKHK